MKVKIEKILIAIILVMITTFNFSIAFATSNESYWDSTFFIANNIANNNESTLNLNISSTNDELSLVSKSAILMDNKTGKVLYDKNPEKKMFPASTTKILTAILVLENCNLNDTVTVSYDAVSSIPDGYSVANLQIGEKLTVEQLLQALLVYSANDAANVLAEYVGGSVDSFVSIMNTKINELGLSDTHFTNAFGKHDENHYTTAHDLAVIMQYCIKNPDFRKLAGSASCAIPATNLSAPRKYTSTNILIDPSNKNYYPYITAGKTGFTTQAGDCLVSCAYKNDLELICVVLGGKTVNGISTRFSETKILYEYGYDNYSIKSVVKENDKIYSLEVPHATKGTKNLDLLSSSSIDVLMKNDAEISDFSPEIILNEDISAPIEEGTVLGSFTYEIDGIKYSADLLASHGVEKSEALNIVLEIFIAFVILLLIYKIFFHKKT